MSTTSNFISLLAAAADALTFGGLSSWAQGVEGDKYQLAASEAQQIATFLQNTIAQDQETLDKLRNKRMTIQQMTTAYPQLRLLYQKYMARRGEMDSEISLLEDKILRQRSEAEQAQAAADQAYAKANNINAPQLAKRWAEGEKI